MYFAYCKSKESKQQIKAKAYGLIKYCCDKAIDVDTYNMFTSGENGNQKEIYLEYNREFRELQKENGKCESYKSRKAYHFVISPEEENVKPEILKQLARDYLEKFYPNGQAIISIHNDNGRNHCHIVLNAVQTDLKKIDYGFGESERKHINGNYLAQAKYVEEDLSKKYNLSITTEKQRKYKKPDVRNNHIDYQYELHREKPTDKTFIQDNIYEILYKNNEKFENLDKLNERIKPLNIEIVKYTTDDNKEQYRYIKTDTGRKFSGTTLGNIFEKNEIDKILNNELTEEIEKVSDIPEITEDTNVEDLITKYSSEYKKDKSFKEQKDKLYDDIIDKIDDLDDKKLKIYNKKHGTDYSKDYFYNKLDTLYKDKKREPEIIIKDLGNLFKLVVNLLKEIISLGLSNQNNYNRGY